MVYRDWETCKARLSSSHGPESGDEAGKVSFDTHPRMVYRDWETCKASLSSSHGPESGDEAGKVSFATHSEDGVQRLGGLQGEAFIISRA